METIIWLVLLLRLWFVTRENAAATRARAHQTDNNKHSHLSIWSHPTVIWALFPPSCLCKPVVRCWWRAVEREPKLESACAHTNHFNPRPMKLIYQNKWKTMIHFQDQFPFFFSFNGENSALLIRRAIRIFKIYVLENDYLDSKNRVLCVDGGKDNVGENHLFRKNKEIICSPSILWT